MPSASRTDFSVDWARGAISQWPALNRAMPALICFAVLLTIAGALIPSFLLPDRLLLLGQQVAPLALVGIGQTLVVLMGWIDLAGGAGLTLSLVLRGGNQRGLADHGLHVPRDWRGDRSGQRSVSDTTSFAGADQYARHRDYDRRRLLGLHKWSPERVDAGDPAIRRNR